MKAPNRNTRLITATPASTRHSAAKHVFACNFLLVVWHPASLSSSLSLSLSQLLHDSLEYLEENSDNPLKRKSPYILKRQAVHTTKSRRPYILKRSTIYWQPSQRPRQQFRGPDHPLSVKMWLCFSLSSCNCNVFSFPVVVFIQSDPSIECTALRPACTPLLSKGPVHRANCESLRNYIYLLYLFTAH